MKNFNISMQILDGTYIHQAIKKENGILECGRQQRVRKAFMALKRMLISGGKGPAGSAHRGTGNFSA